MSKSTKFCIVCSSIALAFLIAFFCVLGVFFAKRKSQKYAVYGADSSVGKFEVEFDGKYWDGSTLKIGGEIIESFKEGDASRKFEHDGNEYYVVIFGESNTLVGYLYISEDGTPKFLEKIEFSKE